MSGIGEDADSKDGLFRSVVLEEKEKEKTKTGQF